MFNEENNIYIEPTQKSEGGYQKKQIIEYKSIVKGSKKVFMLRGNEEVAKENILNSNITSINQRKFQNQRRTSITSSTTKHQGKLSIQH